MADRTVKVSLVAQVSGYVAGMDAAARKTREFSNDSTARLAAQRAAFQDLGRVGLVAGAAIAVGLAVAVRKFAEFDQAMSNVAAVTDATTGEMLALRDAALDAGGATIFTATEAANAIEELGKAGLSTADILGGALTGALSLAASGQLEVARAAEITATTLKQFGLDGDQASHIADVLSAAAGKALGSVEDLAQGLKFVGPVASSMGVSVEETAGALALFADQGLIGEQAGTSLRGVLASLTSPSSQAAAEIDRLGISLYNTKTKGFLGLDNVADQLANAYQNLDDKSRDASLGIIFGNQQVTAARVLFESGGAKVREYTREVNDAGYAARVAAERLDNLRGDLEKLSGALDTALIQTGSGANDVLRSITQSLTFIVDGIGELPGPVLAGGLAVGALAASFALAGGAALIAVPKFVAFRDALNITGIQAGALATKVGLVGAAVGLATIVIGTFIDRQAKLDAVGNALIDTLDEQTGAFTKLSRETVAKGLQDSGAAKTAEQFGVSLDTLTDAVFGNADALEEYNSKIPATAGASGQLGTDIRNLQREFTGLSGKVAEAPDKFNDLKDATAAATQSADNNADALAGLAGQAAAASQEVDDLADALRGFGSAQLSVNDASRKVEAALDDFYAKIAENGSTFDITTEAGRENSAALDQMAKSYLELAAATVEQTQRGEDAIPIIQAGRDQVIAAGIAAGKSAEDAAAYADSLGLIPGNVNTAFQITGLDTAKQGIDNFIREYNGKRIAINIAATRNFADGGYVSGPGTATSDSIPARLSNGEFVANARATAANRAALEYMNRGGVVQGFANGGYVSAGAASGGTQIQVDMRVESSDPYVAAQLAKQGLAAKLATVR